MLDDTTTGAAFDTGGVATAVEDSGRVVAAELELLVGEPTRAAVRDMEWLGCCKKKKGEEMKTHCEIITVAAGWL